LVRCGFIVEKPADIGGVRLDAPGLRQVLELGDLLERPEVRESARGAQGGCLVRHEAEALGTARVKHGAGVLEKPGAARAAHMANGVNAAAQIGVLLEKC
jgi:hypothetical protein